VLCNIHLGALSSPYQSFFSDQSRFAAILDLVNVQLAARRVVEQPRIKTLIVTSFSAGYAGVREILKNPAYYDQVAALTLADGLHCSADPGLISAQMQDFVRYARDAAGCRKVMILTHSSVQTSGYWSTTQTADYLIAALGVTRTAAAANDEIGVQYSRCDTGCFHLRGYLGESAQDHLQHLYAMDKMLVQVMELLALEASPVPQGCRPEESSLSVRVYPNPFNPRTTLRCELGSGGWATLTIFNALGQEARPAERVYVPEGGLEVCWEALDMPAGVYTYRLRSGGATVSGHCVLVK
jgi:hypothetical protein